MPLKYFNIRDKQTVIAETEPQISALWASSDRSPNITQGQDFGWRLAPEVIVELKRLKQNQSKLIEIAALYSINFEDLDEKVILQYISDKTAIENAPVASDEDYTDEYEQEIRRLERAQALIDHPELAAAAEIAPTTTTTTTHVETLEELEARVEAMKATTTTTTVPVTTTTSTKPVTTTSTTKAS